MTAFSYLFIWIIPKNWMMEMDHSMLSWYAHSQQWIWHYCSGLVYRHCKALDINSRKTEKVKFQWEKWNTERFYLFWFLLEFYWREMHLNLRIFESRYQTNCSMFNATMKKKMSTIYKAYSIKKINFVITQKNYILVSSY